MAKASGLGRTTVQQIWRAFGLQPHRTEAFKLSTDPLSSRRCATSSASICIRPRMPSCSGRREMADSGAGPYATGVADAAGPIERHTHDYRRHGTTTLFAALNVKPSELITQFHQRHRSTEFRQFLDAVNAAVPRHLDVHLIIDDYGTHKTPLIRNWFAKRPRFHVHFTPTYGSWFHSWSARSPNSRTNNCGAASIAASRS